VSYDSAAGNGRPAVTETPLVYKRPNMDAINAICAGLEQLTTGIKGHKARGTEIDEKMSNGTLARIKQLDLPEWRFVKRVRPDDPAKSVDIDLDKMLRKVVGGDSGNDMNKGLNQFIDKSGVYTDHGGCIRPDFTEINDLLSDLTDLMNDFVVRGAPYGISENLFDILDVMARHNVTAEQVKGLQYALAKMLAYYEGSEQKWLLQGESGFSVLFDLLTTAVPVIDAEMGNYASMNGKTKGEVFRSLLTSMQNVSKENGMMEFILDTVTIGPYSSGDVLTELNQWMASDLVSGDYTRFYSTLSDMLEDMSDTVSTAPTEESLGQIYEYYGFQLN
jgi:hypothetical protein